MTAAERANVARLQATYVSGALTPSSPTRAMKASEQQEPGKRSSLLSHLSSTRGSRGGRRSSCDQYPKQETASELCARPKLRPRVNGRHDQQLNTADALAVR